MRQSRSISAPVASLGPALKQRRASGSPTRSRSSSATPCTTPTHKLSPNGPTSPFIILEPAMHTSMAPGEALHCSCEDAEKRELSPVHTFQSHLVARIRRFCFCVGIVTSGLSIETATWLERCSLSAHSTWSSSPWSCVCSRNMPMHDYHGGCNLALTCKEIVTSRPDRR